MIELDRGVDTTGLDLWTPAVRLCVGYLQSSAGQQLLESSGSSVLRVLELGAGLGAAGPIFGVGDLDLMEPKT